MRFAWVAVGAAVVAGAAAYAVGDGYTDRMSDPAGTRLVAVGDTVRVAAGGRPARTVVIVADGLRRDAALGMAATRKLAAAGQCLATDVGSPSISRPVYAVISTGLEQDRTGVRSNAETRPAAAESIWEVARQAGLRVEARSELPWWRETFPRGFDAYQELPRAADYLTPPPAADLTLVHPVWIDEEAHDHGAASPEYARGVARLDGELVGLLEGMDLARDLVVFTADHGHTARGGHGGRAPEVAGVLTCFAGRGVAARAGGAPIFTRDLAPALAVLLGLRFPRHMRAGDDDLDAIWRIVDPAAFAPGYLADRRAALERFRAANPRWSEVYAEGRARQALELGMLAALLVAGVGALSLRRRRPGIAALSLGGWMAATVAAAIAVHVWLLGSFDYSAINRREPYVRSASLQWLAIAGAAFLGRWLAARDLRRAVEDQLVFVGVALAVNLGLIGIFGWPLGFPLPAPRFFFLPFFASIAGLWLAVVLAASALVLALVERR